MSLFADLKNLVKTEKIYTAKILKKLSYIEKDKLYCDLGYSSLFKYLVKELRYSEPEATVRVNAVRLMNRSKIAKKKITDGHISLSNAATLNQSLSSTKEISKPEFQSLIELAQTKSNRELKKEISQTLNLPRRETVTLDEGTL